MVVDEKVASACDAQVAAQPNNKTKREFITDVEVFFVLKSQHVEPELMKIVDRQCGTETLFYISLKSSIESKILNVSVT